MQGHVSTHLEGSRSYPQCFQGVAHCSLMDHFQAFPLLPVIRAAQVSPLPLSGHVFGDTAVVWISTGDPLDPLEIQCSLSQTADLTPLTPSRPFQLILAILYARENQNLCDPVVGSRRAETITQQLSGDQRRSRVLKITSE